MAAHEPTLKDVCNQLGSDKVRERQDALATLRQTFSRGSAVEAVKSKGWTAVFSALQIAFDKLKAGIDAFGDDLQKVRSRSFVDQGASQCLIMNSPAF